VLLEDNPPRPEAIRAAVRAVLEQPGYRESALGFQREIRALPGLGKPCAGWKSWPEPVRRS
jgi:hypothetical protein